ncbi:hypothetical protein CDL15_Pgr021415 [Punica granatum]|uniref:AMP-dependent synthetase/ligase domain-containing protein n=1 Tax=Punica granatum TaxID=22663 RepID=A0A218WQD8_PUNGR|nr:hypothetical protein CDL15_Pgr021415 [Punica granatum]
MAHGTDHENYDPSFPEQPVVDLYLPVWARLPAFASKPAFIWVEDGPVCTGLGPARTLTYAELNESVGCISSQLLIPLQRGDRVVVLSPPGLELIKIIFACQRAGLLAVPIMPSDPFSARQDDFHHLVRVLSQTKPKAAIAPNHYITSFRDSVSIKNNTKLASLLQNLRWVSAEDLKPVKEDKRSSSSPSPDSLRYDGCKPEEIYLIQYSSGATGIPKPVLITAGAAAHNVRAARRSYDLHPSSVIVSWLPQYHDCGLMFLLLTIVTGATSILTSPVEFLRRPRIWLEMISEFKATCSPVPSFALPLVVKRGGVDKGHLPIKLWSMRNLILINEPIYRDTVEEFVRVFEPLGLDPGAVSPSYGLAENCTFVSTAWKPSSLANGNSGNFPDIPTYNRLLPSARLGLGYHDDDNDVDMHILVVDEETSSPVNDGVEGEIWVSSPSNASGYLGHPSLTREVFQSRLRDRVSGCFVRTGDRGVIIPHDRYLFVTGRCADTIRLITGKKDDEVVMIHPHYIETAVHKSFHRFLRGGCIVAFQKSRSTVAVVSELQQRSGGGDKEALKRLCEGVRKAVQHAEGVEVGLVALVESGSVPKTTSGKVQRWAAREQLSSGRMRVVVLVEFDRGLDDGRLLGDRKEVVNGGVAATRRGGGVASHEREDIAYTFSSINQPRLRLLSFL